MKRARRSRPGAATERHPQRTREHDRDVEPVSYFNDAVFAIAMTLLVVSIRVPSGTSAETLGRALRGLGSSFTSYGISFIVIGLYWLAFHRQLHYLERFDGTTLVIDLLFLMSVAFLPFPTLLLNRYFTVRALYPPLIFLLSIPVAVAAPQAAEYTWFLVLLGPPLIRRVADR